MVDGVATLLLCNICDEVCKRGIKLKCCGVRACRACAVLKVNKTKKCWVDTCEKPTKSDDLENDVVLRKAVEFFNKNGKMNPEHEKQLKAKAGTKTEKKKKKEVEEESVADKFNKPCRKGDKCPLKGKSCQFIHDDSVKTPTAAKDEKKPDKPALNKGAKPCNYGTRCVKKDCKFSHPDVKMVNKPCFAGDACMRLDCKFQHAKPSDNAFQRAMMSASRAGGRPGDMRAMMQRSGMGGGAPFRGPMRRGMMGGPMMGGGGPMMGGGGPMMGGPMMGGPRGPMGGSMGPGPMFDNGNSQMETMVAMKRKIEKLESMISMVSGGMGGRGSWGDRW